MQGRIRHLKCAWSKNFKGWFIFSWRDLTSPRLSRDVGREETLALLVLPPVPMVKEDILLWARRPPDGTRPLTVPASLWENSLLVSVSWKGKIE